MGLERNLREWEQAIGCCLQMTGYWLQLEIATLQSLKKLYGGGYEIATFINDKYRKVDKITYMFWHARIDGDGIRFAFAPTRRFATPTRTTCSSSARSASTTTRTCPR